MQNPEHEALKQKPRRCVHRCLSHGPCAWQNRNRILIIDAPNCPRSSGPHASHAHNVGVSILKAIGLDDLVAESEEDYVRIAVSLASNP